MLEHACLGCGLNYLSVQVEVDSLQKRREKRRETKVHGLEVMLEGISCRLRGDTSVWRGRGGAPTCFMEDLESPNFDMAHLSRKRQNDAYPLRKLTWH